jgi:putative nucleotidyltransferase with HDIG domain
MNQTRGQQFLVDLASLSLELPYEPQRIQALYQKTGPNSAVSLEEIATMMGKDQGLTAKVLAMANSAYYGFQQEVTTVSRAVTVLGFNEIRTVVLALSIKALTSRKNFPKDFDIQAYWEHQLMVALISRSLASHMGIHGGDDLYTAGVLHDIGKILTAMHHPDDWRSMEGLAQSKDIPYFEAEQEHWGLEHGLIGSMMMAAWNLPSDLTEPVNWHHSPVHSPHHKSQALVLCVSDAMAHVIAGSQAALICPWRELLAKFRLDPDEQIEQAKALLLLHDPGVFAGHLV